MEKVWRDYKRQQSGGNAEEAAGDAEAGGGATVFDRTMELSQIIEQLGIDLEEAGGGGGGGGGGNGGSGAAGSAAGGLLRKDFDLNMNERRYLQAVELGDLATVRRSIESASSLGININCRDSLGRSALHVAIEYEHIELLEVLLAYNLELGDALLHAIQEENIIAVEMLLSSQTERQKKKDLSGLLGTTPSSSFTPDVTPIILAAQIDNYEIIKLLLDRGDRVPKPHELRCACVDCVRAHKEDSLQHSKSRINAYKALASPSLIALSSKDPILTAFELSWEMHRLGRLEHEFREEYENLSADCQKFATALLEQTRSSEELAIVLNQDAGQGNAKLNDKTLTEGERMNLARLKMAIKYKQKKVSSTLSRSVPFRPVPSRSVPFRPVPSRSVPFRPVPSRSVPFRPVPSRSVPFRPVPSRSVPFRPVPSRSVPFRPVPSRSVPFRPFVAHPHCQQLLAALWYEGLPGFRRKHMFFQMGMIGTFAGIFPLLSMVYLVAPRSELGQKMRKPFIKFICHSASYMLFLGFLVLAAIRVEDLIMDTLEEKMQERGGAPSIVEWIIVIYILGFVWQEIKQLWGEGIKAYVTDMWNLLDFITNALYVATITLRGVSYYRVHQNSELRSLHRKYWDAYDPTLISECLFAIANIFSMLKLVNIFTINPHLGPLQISLGRMLNDILKFLFVVVLVICSFACGFNQLYWFYAYQRNKYCQDNKFYFGITGTDLDKYSYCVTRGRTFSNLFEITQSLYWSAYGLIDLSNTDLEYEHSFTEFIGNGRLFNGLPRSSLSRHSPSSPRASLSRHSPAGKLMYGAFSAITFIVLLNMLIAMMNCSFEEIVAQADTEWKFARGKLWISYFDEGGTLPTPFNIIPSPKSFLYAMAWLKDKVCSCSKRHQRSKWQSIRKVVKKVNEKEARYQSVMRDLIKRYLMVRQKSDDKQGVTEDDLNEIKGDISAFRFELLEIFRTNGMRTPAHMQQRSSKGSG
uniref:ANK_REP_REGION domain-containing protein n=2 Tax=Macrostomum lignano TaxID=282301 RepID=A0A1I8JFL9_9PLAT